MEKKIKQSDIKRAIRDIQKLDLDLRKLETRATPDIVGFYGELLAWKELKSKFGWRGYSIGFGSGQSQLSKNIGCRNSYFVIEIKTQSCKKQSEKNPSDIYILYFLYRNYIHFSRCF